MFLKFQEEIGYLANGFFSFLRYYILSLVLFWQVEQLEQEVAELRQALSDKQEQENAMLQVSFVLFLFVDCMLSSFFPFFPNLLWPCDGDGDCLLNLQVLMRVEQEQRVTEDARRFAEQDAAAQRYAAQVLQVRFLTLTTCNLKKKKEKRYGHC